MQFFSIPWKLFCSKIARQKKSQRQFRVRKIDESHKVARNLFFSIIVEAKLLDD